jgi:hypothetical protein
MYSTLQQDSGGSEENVGVPTRRTAAPAPSCVVSPISALVWAEEFRRMQANASPPALL